MAQVSVRFGWGKSSLGCFALAALDVPIVVALVIEGFHGAAVVVGAMIVALLGFGLVHPHRVIALDDDDGPERRVGDLAE